MLLRTFVFKFYANMCFPFCWVELWGRMVTPCLTFEEVPDCFSKAAAPSPPPPPVQEGSDFSTPLPSHTVICVLCASSVRTLNIPAEASIRYLDSPEVATCLRGHSRMASPALTVSGVLSRLQGG